MRISNEGIEFLKELEGVEKYVHRDAAGLPTIGVGHLLTQSEINSGKIMIDGQPVKMRLGLNDEQLNKLFRHDLATTEATADTWVKVPLTQNQFDALTIFTFNIGLGAFKGSRCSKMTHGKVYR